MDVYVSGVGSEGVSVLLHCYSITILDIYISHNSTLQTCLFLFFSFLLSLSFLFPYSVLFPQIMDKMDQSIEKNSNPALEHVESSLTESEYDEFTPEEQKRIIQRIDRRLVVTLGVMYCVSLMDRANLGAAMIAGMGTELVLIGERYVRIF